MSLKCSLNLMSLPATAGCVRLNLQFFHADLLALFAGELAEVAVLAEPQGVIGLVLMLTVVCKLRTSMAVVASLAEAFCIEWLVGMWAC